MFKYQRLSKDAIDRYVPTQQVTWWFNWDSVQLAVRVFVAGLIWAAMLGLVYGLFFAVIDDPMPVAVLLAMLLIHAIVAMAIVVRFTQLWLSGKQLDYRAATLFELTPRPISLFTVALAAVFAVLSGTFGAAVGYSTQSTISTAAVSISVNWTVVAVLAAVGLLFVAGVVVRHRRRQRWIILNSLSEHTNS
jgi:hypothetical protein